MKKYSELREEMKKNDIGQAYLAKLLHVSGTYVSLRINGKMSWSLEDSYKILEILRIPPEQIYYYFPPGGKEVKMPDLSVKEAKEEQSPIKPSKPVISIIIECLVAVITVLQSSIAAK